MESSDDAGVYRLNSETALIQTLDFFTPIVDSPFEFGCIAAANSLSDVYAMGGKPVTAMNIVCFPVNDLPEEVLKETMAGGLKKIHEAGAVLVGGHSVDDKEFKYGLSVTGTVHPEKILTNNGAITGEYLILTKPLGTGIIATAIKGKVADRQAEKILMQTASTLNKYAADIMCQFNPSACTDVTGFGLAGHVVEIARGSKKSIRLYSKDIPIIEKAREYAAMGLIPAGTYSTKNFFKKNIAIDSKTDSILADLIFDPQTSGGLVFTLHEKAASECLKIMLNEGINAALIGEIIDTHDQGYLSIV